MIYTKCIDLGNSFIKIFYGGISCPYYFFVYWVVQIEVGMPNDRTIKGNECENIQYEVYQLRLAGIFIFEPYFGIWYQLWLLLKKTNLWLALHMLHCFQISNYSSFNSHWTKKFQALLSAGWNDYILMLKRKQLRKELANHVQRTKYLCVTIL